jgi:hypothetical protein
MTWLCQRSAVDEGLLCPQILPCRAGTALTTIGLWNGRGKMAEVY